MSKDHEELSYDIFPPSPISEAQRQYLPNYPEREFEVFFIYLLSLRYNCIYSFVLSLEIINCLDFLFEG